MIKSEIKDEPPLPLPLPQSGTTNLVLSSPPRSPPQRGVVPQSLVKLLSLATLALGESASEGESEGESKHKGTGDPRGSEDLQDIREMLDEADKPTD